MKRHLLFAACLATSLATLAASPADPVDGPGWFKATIAESLRRLQGDRPPERSRYMACGYVAPEIVRDSGQEAIQGDDNAVADMLERLRSFLRRAAEER